MNAVTSSEAAEWIGRYREALLRVDADAIGNLFAAEAVVKAAPFEPAVRGRDTITEWYREALQGVTVESMVFTEPTVREREAAAEWWILMTEQGKQVTEPGSLHLELDDEGNCTRLGLYPVLADGRQEKPAGWPLDY
jgi:hypothetical protein